MSSIEHILLTIWLAGKAAGVVITTLVLFVIICFFVADFMQDQRRAKARRMEEQR